MTDRENSRARSEALRAAKDGAAGDGRPAYEDALARYLRLQSELPRPRDAGDEDAADEK